MILMAFKIKTKNNLIKASKKSSSRIHKERPLEYQMSQNKLHVIKKTVSKLIYKKAQKFTYVHIKK